MLFAGFCFFMTIGFYFEFCLPKEYGTRKHPCFMFLPSTYSGCCKKSSASQPFETNQVSEERQSLVLN